MKNRIFELWNTLKQKLERDRKIPFFKEKEIWWMHMGKNIGFEQDGKNREFARPAIIISIFSKDLFWAIPLTTKKKKGKYYFSFQDKNTVNQNAILSQMRPFSPKRLQNKVGETRDKDFESLKKAVKKLL
jgi:mRNA interferase MazF